MPRVYEPVLTAEEQKFIRFYMRAGGTEDQIPKAEQQSRAKRGSGPGILKRKHVQEEIARRKAILEMEQAKLDAQDINRREVQEEQRANVTLDLIEGVLKKVLDLDAATHGHVLLEGIKIGLVYTGTIRNGNMVRTIPADPTLDANKTANTDSSFYRSIFNGLRNGENPVDAAPIMPEAAPTALNPEAPKPALPTLKAPAPKAAAKPGAAKSGAARSIEIT